MKKTIIALTILAAASPMAAMAREDNHGLGIKGSVSVESKIETPFIKQLNRIASSTEKAKAEAKAHFGLGVQKAVYNILNRLTHTASAFVNVATRIDAFIKLEQSNGINMSASVEALAKANTDIAAANTKITAANTALATALASTSPKGEMAGVRAAVKDAETALKTAKQSLQATLRTVRVDVSATTTAAVH